MQPHAPNSGTSLLIERYVFFVNALRLFPLTQQKTSYNV